ncbi:Hypothetical protein, putative [Bodo saltans]|uniref:Uncharacterized protein n=1 Tax=Bodo saltans TaxID=75058 RepID=A0A0S4ILD3_BODSA|nr:Hypothetical protein, putative [Bodo saltans]|eukprot:CUE71185.1 Hypothetical protein, putative [Bodo saltans]
MGPRGIVVNNKQQGGIKKVLFFCPPAMCLIFYDPCGAAKAKDTRPFFVFLRVFRPTRRPSLLFFVFVSNFGGPPQECTPPTFSPAPLDASSNHKNNKKQQQQQHEVNYNEEKVETNCNKKSKTRTTTTTTQNETTKHKQTNKKKQKQKKQTSPGDK